MTGSDGIGSESRCSTDASYAVQESDSALWSKDNNELFPFPFGWEAIRNRMEGCILSVGLAFVSPSVRRSNPKIIICGDGLRNPTNLVG